MKDCSAVSPLLNAALNYLRLGLSVIPIGSHGNGKQPSIREWKPYQTALPKEIEVRGWFLRSGVVGVAIIFGPVSGGVYCRDFDKEAAYKVWAEKNPTLAATLPTVKTARGYHVYFRSKDSLRTKKYTDGELRGEGAYCLAPPSLHPDDILYKWRIPITGTNLIIVEQPCIVFSEEGTDTESIEKIESTEAIEETERIDEIDDNRSDVLVVGCVLSEDDINDVVQWALPNEKSRNHDYLFILARAVKTQEKKQGKRCSTDLLKKIFESWYAKNQSQLRARQTKYDYDLEFQNAYQRAIYPFGEGIFEEAWERAKNSPSPRVALELFEEPQMRQLVSLCRELQREAGDNPFFLAYSKVTRLFKLPNNTVAGRRLNDLIKKGIISEVEKHTAKKATRYRYMHPLNDADTPLAKPHTAPAEDLPNISIADLDEVELVHDGNDLF